MPRRPLDILNAAVTLLLLALCLAGSAAGRLPRWPLLAGQFVLMLLGVWVIARLARRPALSWPLAVVVDFYPVAYVPLVFDSLGPLVPALNPAANPGRDGWLIAADRFLLGTDPTVWLQRFVRPWLTDLMYLAYCAYFIIPFVVAGYILWNRSLSDLRRYIFIAVLAFYTSYAGYFIVPAKGPRATLTHTVKLQTTPISRAVTDGMNWVERNKNDVFPSGHVMLTAVCLLLAWREGRWLFLGLLPVGLGVVVSTVYCRYHYVIDVLAGLVLALPMPAVGGWLYERLYERLTKPAAGDAVEKQ